MNNNTTSCGVSIIPKPMLEVSVRAEWTDMDGREHVVIKHMPWTSRGKRYVARLSNEALYFGGSCTTRGCVNNGGEAA